jgi:hypothetical protein
LKTRRALTNPRELSNRGATGTGPDGARVARRVASVVFKPVHRWHGASGVCPGRERSAIRPRPTCPSAPTDPASVEPRFGNYPAATLRTPRPPFGFTPMERRFENSAGLGKPAGVTKPRSHRHGAGWGRYGASLCFFSCQTRSPLAPGQRGLSWPRAACGSAATHLRFGPDRPRVGRAAVWRLPTSNTMNMLAPIRLYADGATV